jgi:hypothetical protein
MSLTTKLHSLMSRETSRYCKILHGQPKVVSPLEIRNNQKKPRYCGDVSSCEV